MKKMGIGDWGLGTQSPIPNPQSPIPNPQSPGLYFYLIFYNNKLFFIEKIKFSEKYYPIIWWKQK